MWNLAFSFYQSLRTIQSELQEAAVVAQLNGWLRFTKLEQYFSEPEARRLLDTAIDWGRYAELFAYDDVTGELYLEEEEGES